METKNYFHRREQAIAVIGMACRFPDADDYHSFWCNLRDGRNSVRKISSQRWALSELKEEMSAPEYCAAIEGIDLFDHGFFNFSRREVESMDPQQRLVLEEAFHCIEDAGVAMDTLRRRFTSVYLGITGSDYSLLALNRGKDVDSHAAFGNFECIAANRISHAFGFRGVSLSLDAASASSLVAVHEAKKSLLLRESDFAMIAAVTLPFHPWRYIGFDKAHMLSVDGQCKTFDSHANGFVYGDGVSALLLQRLDDAIRDGNHVYGVIRGSAVNHCGHLPTITAPSVAAQRDVVLAAWGEAGISLETAGYIEAHGTGTALGDPIEIEALTQAFAQHTSRLGFCKIGSVKSNIGHLFSAAGLAGLIKVLLMMRHRRVPKTLNVELLNPVINFAVSPFLPALEASEWTSSDDNLPLRAGVSSLGFGGVNAHVVVEEYHCESIVATTAPREELPFLLSAKTPAALHAMFDRWSAFVASDDFGKASFTDLCLTLAAGRESLPYRFGVCLHDKACLARVIEHMGSETAVTAAKGWGLHLTGLAPTVAHSVARGWRRHEVFQRHFQEISQAVYEVDPITAAWDEGAETELGGIFAFAVECACVRTLLELGMVPQQLTSSGTGLWAALAVCGVLSPADAAALLVNQCEWKEAKLHRPTAIPFYDSVGQGLVMPWRFDPIYLDTLIDGLCVSSGLVSELVGRARLLIDSQFTFKKYMDEWCRDLQPAGLDLHAMLRSPLPHEGSYPFTSQIALFALAIASALRKFFRRWDLSDPLPLDDPRLREIVDLLADDVMPQPALVDLFTRGPAAVEPVAKTLAQRQARMNLTQPYTRIREYSQTMDEIGDTEVWLQCVLANADVPGVPTGGARLNFGVQARLYHDGQPDEVFDMHQQPGSAFPLLLVGLWRHGVDVEWGKLYPEGSFHKLPLPGYPFQRESHWLEPVSIEGGGIHPVPAHTALSLSSVPQTDPATQMFVQGNGHREFGGAKSVLALSGAAPRDLATTVQEYLAGLFAKELRTPCTELTADTPFGELGVNSILLAGLVQGVEEWLGEKLDPSIILEHRTITRLSAYLAAQYPAAIQGAVSGSALEVRQSADMSNHMMHERVVQRLSGMFADELRMPQTELALEIPFGDYGVDSILLSHVLKRIEEWLGNKFDPTMILENPTIGQLATHLMIRHADRVAIALGVASAQQSDLVVAPMPGNRPPADTVEGRVSFTYAGKADETLTAGKVAVIGMACHFPEAPDKAAFWRNLVAGRNSIVEVPALRWDISQHYSPAREKHKSISKWGGFIDGIEYFDPEYFGLKVNMAPHVDPLVRQFLETAVQTFADAGYGKMDLAGRRVGVFVGSRVSTYRNRIVSLLPETILGVDQNFIASHVSHLFDLRGPNLVLDSACSSSLVAIHMACRSLLAGDCEMALIGGVDILLDEGQYLMLSECQALSPDGQCFTFDERANGFVPGEGSGAVLLKPLADAIRDGDSIYAVIDGFATNNDGRTMGVTTPNPEAQRDVIMQALRQARVSPADISYIETHGTGTMIGDPIELRALTEVFREATGERQFCGVGSVKTNIGHLLCAAGVAGFIKVVLSLHHKQLPPTLNCERPNPRFNFEASPFYPNIRLSDWHPRGGLCRAGISSFGFSGTNAHVVLSEFAPECFHLPYLQVRRSLPPAVFNRRRFWIDRDRCLPDGLGTLRAPRRDFLPSHVAPIMELIDETL